MKEQIRALTESFLKVDTPWDVLLEASDELYSLLTALTELDADGTKNRENMETDDGIALGATWAAMCIQDIDRTRQFSLAVDAAIDEQSKNKVGPVHLLYAGTGPFMTILLPALLKRSPSDLTCTLIELNPESHRCLQRLITVMELEDYVKAVHNSDAVRFQVDPGDEVDILLSETMQAGLQNEHQVKICLNLLPQISESAIMIPERIALEVIAVDHLTDLADIPVKYKTLDTFLVLDKAFIIQYVKRGELIFPKVRIEIQPDLIAQYQTIDVHTNLVTYGPYDIPIFGSGLTLPIQIDNLSKDHRGKFLEVQYRLTPTPGPYWEWSVE